MTVWMLILGLALAANLPFLSDRIGLVGPARRGKGMALRLFEMLCLGAIVVAIGTAFEARIGQRAPQGWEFYAVIVCLLLTLGFPGFVWRQLRRRRDA
jgi:Protein of unknown function (DUF2818)